MLLLSINERKPWEHKDGQSEEDLGLALFSDKPSFARRPSPHVGTVNIDVVVEGLLGAVDVPSPRREEAGVTIIGGESFSWARREQVFGRVE